MGYRWLLFVHVASALLFFFCHGVSMAVALRVSRERDRERLRALLDLSSGSPLIGFTWSMFAVLLLSGLALGFLGRWWGSGWIWVSLGLLIAVSVAAGVLGSAHFNRIRAALGLPSSYEREAPAAPVDLPADEFNNLLRSRRPLLLAVIGVSGIVTITWLMMFKPF